MSGARRSAKATKKPSLRAAQHTHSANKRNSPVEGSPYGNGSRAVDGTDDLAAVLDLPGQDCVGSRRYEHAK